MGVFKIEGGHTLKGEITPQGAKNEALQVLCAVLLTDQKVTIHNIPDILDVNRLISLLENLGVKIQKLGKGSYSFQADEINLDYLKSEAFYHEGQALRGSILIVGPLLTRFGVGYMPKPGGDKIGRRRLDTHFNGFIKLGAHFEYDESNFTYSVVAERLKGTYMLLEEASITGTSNVIMAAVLAEGKTTIYNAACEPYVQQLCLMLQRMGADITGIGSNLLRIRGVQSLAGTEHTLLPDMIEVGSFIGLAAITQSDLTIQDVHLAELGIIPHSFERLGIHLEAKGDNLIVYGSEPYEIETFMDGSIMTIADAPWPGLTPDLLSVFLVVATQARGAVLIHQKMFESRLFFVDKLIDMGAQIILCDPHRATVIGLNRQVRLRSTSMTSPDIRAGVALLLAALAADGTSTIYNVEQIDRGYELIDVRLNALGAHIERISQ